MIPFDEAFSGWGWEDTDWGIRATKYFPVRHINIRRPISASMMRR
jgi:hypothetical protein